MKNIVGALSFLLALLGTGSSFAGTIKEYTADMVDVKSEQVVNRYYIAEKKMRIDTFGAQGGRQGAKTKSDQPSGIAIIRLDQKKMYILQEDKTYIEMPITDDKIENAMDMSKMFMGGTAPTRKVENLGTETVSGYKAEKNRITTTIAMMGQKHTTTHTEWIAREFSMPVRMQEPNGRIMEMRNIKTGAPSASVFEMPAGYKRNTQMEEMMKSMQQKQKGK